MFAPSKVLAAIKPGDSLGSDLKRVVHRWGNRSGGLLLLLLLGEFLLGWLALSGVVGVGEGEARRGRGVVALDGEQAGLEGDDIIAQDVVFVLEDFVGDLDFAEVADLLFEFLYVAFFSLAEGSL